MRVEAIAVTLRPRTMGEAADLGQRLVQVHAASVWRCFAPLWLLLVLLAIATLPIAPWLPTVLLFMLKPWADRALLFVYARAVFGQRSGLADLWAARSEALLRGWLPRLLVARLSPWRAFTMALAQLEGQHGRAARKRRALLLSGRRGPAGGLQIVYAHLELVLVAGVLGLLVWFLPSALLGELWREWVGGTNQGLLLAQALLYGAVVLLLEPFYVASGFAMYLNRRVELEAWDVEQELRHAL